MVMNRWRWNDHYENNDDDDDDDDDDEKEGAEGKD